MYISSLHYVFLSLFNRFKKAIKFLNPLYLILNQTRLKLFKLFQSITHITGFISLTFFVSVVLFVHQCTDFKLGASCKLCLYCITIFCLNYGVIIVCQLLKNR